MLGNEIKSIVPGPGSTVRRAKAATMLNERFFDSVIWFDSMVDRTKIIGYSAGDLYQFGDVARQNAGTYGKDTSSEIGF